MTSLTKIYFNQNKLKGKNLIVVFKCPIKGPTLTLGKFHHRRDHPNGIIRRITVLTEFGHMSGPVKKQGDIDYIAVDKVWSDPNFNYELIKPDLKFPDWLKRSLMYMTKS